MHTLRMRLLTGTLALVFAASDNAKAQDNQGFKTKLEVSVSGPELLENPDLWMLEVQFKPLRMQRMRFIDPQSGKQVYEWIWYLVYRVINRELDRKADTSNTVAANGEDTRPQLWFVPRIALVTDDNGEQNMYPDRALPEVQKQLATREGIALMNSLQLSGVPPKLTPKDGGTDNAAYGVAIFRGVDPKTDYFSIYMNGFSNAYKYVRGPVSFVKLQELSRNGGLETTDTVWDSMIENDWALAASIGDLFQNQKQPPKGAMEKSWFYSMKSDYLDPEQPPPIWRKSIVQKYWRPGDEFRQDEVEIRQIGQPRWLYRPLPIVTAQPPKPAPPAAKPPAGS